MWQIGNIQVSAGVSLAPWQPVESIEIPDWHGGAFVAIDFSADGNSACFRKDGWSSQEPDMIWAIGPRSTLRIPFQASGRAVVLEMDVAPCRKPPEIAGQYLRVRANGTPIGDTRLDVRELLCFEIAPEIAGTGGYLDIELEFPGFFQPRAMRFSVDDRALSGAFRLVRAYTKDMAVPPLQDVSAAVAPRFVSPSAQRAAPPADAPLPPATVYGFGLNGNINPFLRDGWHAGEDGLTWTIDTLAGLELPGLAGPGAYALSLDVNPMIVPGAVPSQEVTILLDRIVVGQFALTQQTALIVPLPRELTEGRFTLPLSFAIPDPCRPVDHGVSLDRRLLGLAFREIALVPVPPGVRGLEAFRTVQADSMRPLARSDRFLGDDAAGLTGSLQAFLGTDLAGLLKGYETLGPGPAFCAVQRALGCEAVNFFRFATGDLAGLTHALRDGLAAAADARSIVVELGHGEPRGYEAVLIPYGFRWPCFVLEHEAAPMPVWTSQAIRFDYLRRKFFEGLRGGHKTYVAAASARISDHRAMSLLLELRRHGPAALLCVEPACPDHPAGTAELVVPGLIRGYVSNVAPESTPRPADLTDWIKVLANAALLRRLKQDTD